MTKLSKYSVSISPSSRESSVYERSRSRTSYHKRRASLERGRSRTSHSFRQKEASLNKKRGKRREKDEIEDESEDDREEQGRRDKKRNGDREEIRNKEEIAELRLVISDMAKELKELRETFQANIQDQTANLVGRPLRNKRTQLSSSPEPLAGNTKKVRKNLESMDYEYKKAFRDEIILILKGLDESLFIDYKQRWIDIERHVFQNIMPAIKRVLGDRFQYTDIELKKVLQNLHRHRRDSYTVSLDPLKSKANKQRTGTNSRRKDKKERRQRGIQHMVNIKDQMLIDLQPSMAWDDWIKDLKGVINNSTYHSDEISESDTEKVQEEKNMNIRPTQKENSNHVLHVYDKQWRSSRIRHLLRHADEMGERIQNIKVERKRWYNNQLYVENNSKPPHNAPEWVISSSYHTDE